MCESGLEYFCGFVPNCAGKSAINRAHMLPAKRQARILEVLRAEQMVSLKDLSEALGISISTVRRDVDYLEDAGYLARTHGGAISTARASTTFEPEAAIASAIESAAKVAIGAAAAQLIQPGQSVLFDSGTTTAAAARAAASLNIPFTAMTNDVLIASCLSQNALVQTSVTGGTIRAGTTTLLGADAVNSVARLRADIAFVGTHAITPEVLSDTSLELADLKRRFLAAADRVILLVDSSKFFNRAFCAFGETSAVDLLLTDSRISADAISAFKDRGVELRMVDVAP